MHPIHFEGAKEMHKPADMTDDDCFSLWAMPVDHTYTDNNGNPVQGKFWVEMWQPSKEDIEAINAGRPIILQIHSIGLPPVAVFTLDGKGNSNDAG